MRIKLRDKWVDFWFDSDKDGLIVRIKDPNPRVIASDLIRINKKGDIIIEQDVKKYLDNIKDSKACFVT